MVKNKANPNPTAARVIQITNSAVAKSLPPISGKIEDIIISIFYFNPAIPAIANRLAMPMGNP
jgi:hypothetical protein